MEADAETLFDYLGKRYEDAFADSPNLCKFIATAAQNLPAQSKVLDVGCGTGKPVANILASMGHDVYGIDISQEMVNIASSQVKGTFQKVDMRNYKPAFLMDGIFVVLSLFQITPGETYSMIYQWSQWLKPGCLLVIGVTPSTSLPENEVTYDATWDCHRQMQKPWMDKYTNETFFSEDGWQRMLQDAGFESELSSTFPFTPNDPDHQSTEIHYLVLARKNEAQPLLGPYPYVSEENKEQPVIRRNFFDDRLVSDDLSALLKQLSCRHEQILVLGDLPQRFRQGIPEAQFFDGPTESLPFESDTFDVVFMLWKLEYIVDVKTAIQETVRVSRRAFDAKIITIQGAPDSELSRFLNTTPSLSPIAHQGRLLASSIEHLRAEGFSDNELTRIDTHYSFLETDIEERCNEASSLLSRFSASDCNRDELIPRLKLHFEGSRHAIGHGMVVSTSRLCRN